ERQFLVPALRFGDRIRVAEVIKAEPADAERFRADAGDLFVNVTVEALNERNDDHHRRHADDHPEQRQGRAQFMRPDRVKRQFDSFSEIHMSFRRSYFAGLILPVLFCRSYFDGLSLMSAVISIASSFAPTRTFDSV